MTRRPKRQVMAGLTMASSLAWMSIVPAVAVIAHSAPTVTPGSVHLSGPIRPTNGSATFTASASDPNGTAEYQFWVESPTGQWRDMQNYSTGNTFTLATPSQGDYLVVVDVLDQAQVAAGDWSMAQTTMPDGVFNGSTVSVTSSASGSVAKGTSITLTATSSGIFSPLYQFWYQDPSGAWHQSGAYQSSKTFTFTAGMSGPYKFVAYAKSPEAANDQHGALESNVGKQVAYGTASQVVATPATQTVVADKAATGTVTYTVEDRHGDRVANFSGMLTLTDSGAGLGISTGGVRGDMYAVTSGIASVSFVVPHHDAGRVVSVVADQLTTAATAAGGVAGQAQVANVSYSSATAMVTAQTAYASALMLSSNVSGLANNAPDAATVTVSIGDQAGQPYTSSHEYFAELTLAGSGSFSSSSAQTTEVVPLLPTDNSTATATVFTATGASGTVTVSATPVSGDILSVPAPVSISLYEVGVPSHLAVTSSMGVAGGLTYTTYTVMVEDAQGHVITTGAGSGINGGTLTLNSNSNNLVVYAGAAPTGTPSYFGQQTLPSVPITNGAAVFTVESDYYQSTPATISLTDTSSLGLPPATLSYTFTLGLPGYAQPVLMGFEFPAINGLPGQREVIQAQLTDVNSSPVAEAGQPIWFTVTDHGGVLALPNGASGVGDTYEALTNASGVATITASLTPSAAFGVGAGVSVSGSLGSVGIESPDYYAVAPSNYATQLTTTLTGGRVGGGSQITGEVIGLNALGSPVAAPTGDSIVVSSSNSGVLSLNPFRLNASGTASVSITAESTGTATLTFTDLSNPSATATATYTVVPGSPAPNAQLYYQGQVVGAFSGEGFNYVSVTSGQVDELWVKNVDGGGNPIPVVGQTPLQVVLPAVANGAWATAAGGPTSSVAVVNIPPGQSSAPVWFYDAGGPATTARLHRSVAMDAAQTIEFFPTAPQVSAGTVAGTEYVTGYTLYGQLVSSGDPIWLSFSSGTTSGATASGAPTAGQLTLGSTPTAVEAGVEGELTAYVTVPNTASNGQTMRLTAQDAPTGGTETASVTIAVGG